MKGDALDWLGVALVIGGTQVGREDGQVSHALQPIAVHHETLWWYLVFCVIVVIVSNVLLLIYILLCCGLLL